MENGISPTPSHPHSVSPHSDPPPPLHPISQATTPAATALQRHTCYDLLPVSYKVIVFDTSLPVKKALAALLQHGVQSAPLWDSIRMRFAGMLTVTDFINLIRHYYAHTSYESALDEIEQLQISGLREIQSKMGLLRPQNIAIHPMQSLYEGEVCVALETYLKTYDTEVKGRLTASKLLLKDHLHRIPLVDRRGNQETIVSVVTQYKILKYLAANAPAVTKLGAQLHELGIGTFENLATATATTPLIQVLNLFVERNISAVPIVDDQGMVLDVYEKYDVLMLAREGAYYDLEMPVSEALVKRAPDFEGIHTCTLTDTLGHVLETIRRMPVHRFIVVKDGRLQGVVSLSDLLGYLIEH
ncbi:AMP-activated serine/threonine-protein kinase regulatory subunit [Thoreauomyces humboldtii]|nr:AMP-activated serine/threonine-protein kinase regulatory subunit [Thoreauomyces humboldtii]